jgi:hypothetical protein
LKSILSLFSFRSTTIQDACSIIVNPAITNDVAAYAAFVRSMMDSQCVPHEFSYSINFLSQTTWESDAAQDSCKPAILKIFNYDYHLIMHFRASMVVANMQ